MINFFRSWKTTIVGCVLLGISIYYISNGYYMQAVPLITMSIGLIMAKDYNTSGKDKK